MTLVIPDLLRCAMTYRFYQTDEGEFEPRRLTLAAVMTRNPQTLSPTHLARDALLLMRERGFRHVPVVQAATAGASGRLMGLVTETDLLKKVLHGKHLTDDEQYHAMLELMLPLEQIMTRSVRSLRPEDEVRQAVSIMQEERVRCVPITDAEGHLLGVVTQTDLMALLRHMLD